MLNEDYRDILQCLAAEKASFLLVGAYAMAAHGYPRATMDIDLWVRPSPENAEAVLRALLRFGASLQGLTAADLERDDTIFQIGVAPRRIDLITGATGLRFDEAMAHSVEADLEGLRIRVLSVDDLIRNKRATGRTKDRADAEALDERRRNGPSD
jgi:hypothetical protein